MPAQDCGLDISRRQLVCAVAAWTLPLHHISSAFAQTKDSANLDIVGLAHAAALSERPISALGGTIYSLLEAQKQQLLAAARLRELSREDVKLASDELSGLNSLPIQEIVSSYRRGIGLRDFGMISAQSASKLISAAALLSSDILGKNSAGTPVPRLPSALEVAVTGPIIRASLAALGSSAGKLDSIVASFASTESPISLKINSLAAIEYLPESSKTLLSGLLNENGTAADKLSALVSEQVRATGKSLSSDIAKIKAAADAAGDLAGLMNQKNKNIQLYATSLNLAAGIIESFGGSGLAKDMRSAASIMQQSYTAYQLFAAGTMGPLGAIALLSSSASLLGGNSQGDSTSVQIEMLTMVLGELKEMRQEFRQRLVAIDTKLDTLLDRIEKVYSETVKGNQIALLNFAEIRKDLQGVLGAVEGVAREKDLNEFSSTKGLLITAIQTNNSSEFATQISNIHTFAHTQAKSSYFVGRPFQQENLRTKVARFRSAEMLIGSVNHALEILKEPLAAVEVANPVEWARGTIAYLEALQAKPDFAIPKVAEDIQSLWNDGNNIRQTITAITRKSTIHAAISGYALCVAEKDLWKGILPDPAATIAAPSRSLRLDVREALIEYFSDGYKQPIKKPVPTKTVKGFIGPVTIHDLFNSGRFYYDGSGGIQSAFRFEADDQDPLLVAQARGILDINLVASYSNPFTIMDAPNRTRSLYSITIKKGADAGRVFGGAPSSVADLSSWRGLIMFMDKEPNLNGTGNWWYWPSSAATDRFSDHNGLLNYCADLIVRDEANSRKAGIGAWMQSTKFKLETLGDMSALLQLSEYASALRMCVSFSQWRMRFLEVEDARLTLPGEAWASNALEDVDIPSSPASISMALQKSVDEALLPSMPSISLQSVANPEGQLSHWAAASTAVASSFANRLVSAKLLRYLNMASQFDGERTVPIVDIAMRQLASVAALRGVTL